MTKKQKHDEPMIRMAEQLHKIEVAKHETGKARHGEAQTE